VDDAEIVATIAAGELDGLAAALDQYAVSLFEYCHSLAPEAAVDAVHDTFIVAWCKVADLRDPGRLYSWLETVAGNECFRRTLTDGEPPQDQAQPTQMPPGLPGRVISECADETPAGRALRVWVTNRAGPYDRDGFPAASPGRRRYLTGRGRLAMAAAAVAVLAVAGAASAALVSTGGPRHNTASGTAPDTGAGVTGAPATSGASLPTTPASPIASTPAGRVPRARSSSPESAASAASAAPRDAMGTGRAQASPPTVMMATVPPPAVPPPPPPPPAQGVLAENPPQLVFVLGGGGGNGGTLAKAFQLTAENGPVNGYTIVVPPNLPGTLIVSPASGSLPAGGTVRITVAAVSTVAFTADLTIYPGDIVVQVTVKVKDRGKGNEDG